MRTILQIQILLLIFALPFLATGQNSSPLSVKMKTESLPNIILHDEKPGLIQITNNTSESLKINVFYEIKDGEDELTLKEWNEEVRLSDGETFEQQEPLSGKFGMYNLHYEIQIEGKSPVSGHIGYANMVRADQHNDRNTIMMGLQGMKRVKNYEQAVKIAKAMGASVCRESVPWNNVEPEKGDWKFEDFDKKYKILAENGIAIQSMLTYCTRWAAPEKYKNEGNANWGPWAAQMPVNIDDWRNYVRKVGEHYNGQAFYWEIWNEADWGYFKGTADDYIELLKVAYEELKKINPENSVMTSGFASADPHGGNQGDADLQARTLKEAAGYIDYHTMHQHGSFETFVNQVGGKLIPYRESIGFNKPLYFNESSENSRLGKVYQAETVVKKVLYAFSVGSLVYDLFSYYDPHDGPYGIVEPKTQYPKPVMPAYSFLSSRVQGKKFVEKLDVGAGRYVFVFKDYKETLISYWNQNGLTGRGSLLLSGAGGSVKRYDMYGNVTDLKLKNGMLALDLDYIPQYVVIPSAEVEIKNRQFIAEQLKPLFNIPGKSLDARVMLGNNTSFDIEISCNWDDDSSPEKIKLKAGENQLVQKQFNNFDKSKQTITFNWKCDELASSGKLIIPVSNNAILIKKNRTEEPLFIVNSRKQLKNFAEADPTRGDQNWTGPDDLSAKIWVSATDEQLIIETDITDDIRMQKGFPSEKIWLSESIQLVLNHSSQNGNWQICVAPDIDGKRINQILATPAGFEKEKLHRTIQYSESAKGNNSYAVKIALPLDAMGLTYNDLKDGIRLNMLFNEDDNHGVGRVGWMRIADGIGGQINTDYYPLLIVE